MNVFDQTGNLYKEIENIYSKKELENRIKGFNKKEAEYSLKRKLNDQAYFLFMFTRLEERIKDLSDVLIANKINSGVNWEYKKAWAIIDKRKDRMPLMDRVALLTDSNGTDYSLIKSYYHQRNSIAHGGSFTVPITISTVIADLKRLNKDLKRYNLKYNAFNAGCFDFPKML